MNGEQSAVLQREDDGLALTVGLWALWGLDGGVDGVREDRAPAKVCT